MQDSRKSSGAEPPIIPVHWEDGISLIPRSWRENKSFQRGHGYAPRIGALDIETSSNDEFAWLYLWTFAIDDIIVYGRTAEELRQWLRRLSQALDLRTDYRLLVYIHNAKYDLTFLKHVLCMASGRKNDFIARSKRQIIKCVVDGVYEIRDSAVYSEMPLKMMGIEIDLPKLEEEHDVIRTPETELQEHDIVYCGRDSHILTRYYRIQAEEYGGIGKIPMTATGRVKRIVTQCFEKEDASIRNKVLARQLITKHVKEGKEVTEKDAEQFERNKYVLDCLRKAFFGGFCYSSVLWGDTEISPENGAKNGMISADIDACYASMMLTKRFPMTRFQPIPDEHIPKTQEQFIDIINHFGWYENRALLLRVRMDGIEARVPDFGFLPAWYKYHANEDGISTIKRSSRIRKAKHLEMILTDVDFIQLLQWYKADGETDGVADGITVVDGLWSTYGTLPDYIIDTIIILYMGKKQMKQQVKAYKKRGEDVPRILDIEYRYRKTMLARLYGVFVQDPIRMLYEWDEEKHTVTAKGQSEPDNVRFSGVLYQWGVWVAAWARDTLLNMCAAVGCTNGVWDRSLLYCDTDCVRWIVDEGNQKELYIDMYNAAIDRQIAEIITREKIIDFHFKYGIDIDYQTLEGCGRWNIDRYERYKQIGIKQYAYVENGFFKAKIAGLSTDNTYFDQFETIDAKMEAFSSSMVIPAENSNLLKTMYIDKEMEADVIDVTGQKRHVSAPASVLLVPTDYRARDDNPAEVFDGIDFNEIMIEFNKLGVPIVPARYGME